MRKNHGDTGFATRPGCVASSISVNLVRTITAQIENADQSSANAMMPTRIRSPRQSAIANPAAGSATMKCITRSVGATTP